MCLQNTAMFRVFADEDESFYWAKVALCIFFLILTVLSLTGCGDSEFERQRQIAETNQRIANACIPYADEQRIVEWAVGADGDRVLFVTVRQPIGRKGNIAQFTVTSESELRQ